MSLLMCHATWISVHWSSLAATRAPQRRQIAADSSATAEIASRLPDSRVLKAFNTNFAATLASGLVGDQPTTVLIAGEDDDAKAALTEIITAGGLHAIDAGPLARARDLEALGFLQFTLAAAGKIPWTGGFTVH